MDAAGYCRATSTAIAKLPHLARNSPMNMFLTEHDEACMIDLTCPCHNSYATMHYRSICNGC